MHKILYLLIVFLTLGVAHASNQCTTEVIQTASGPVCGSLGKNSNGKQASSFLGIPFAASTAGDNRWADPKPRAPWKDVLPALSYGAICPQPASSVNQQAQSEDCLFLNICTPEKAHQTTQPLPVMVWIPGGGFTQGTGGDPIYDGSTLASRHDVIVVTINYRLGMLGFLLADDLDGNYALRDQQEALRWVQKNIRKFGGDPDKVTIFGESAGAVMVSQHATVIPTSQSLFRAAIMESNLLGLPLMSQSEARTSGLLFKRLTGCETIKCLKELPVETILKLQAEFQGASMRVFNTWSGYNPIAPVMDGKLIVDSPLRVIQSDRQLKPMIAGTNMQEGYWFSGQIKEMMGAAAFNSENYLVFLSQKVGQNFERLFNHYGQVQKDNFDNYTSFFTDFVFTCANHQFATNAARLGKPARSAFMYQFTHVNTADFNLSGVPACKGKVCHTDELPYVFHTQDAPGVKVPFTPSEVALSDQMMIYWTNFAKTLNPNQPTAARVMWPESQGSDPQYLYLNDTIKTGSAPVQAGCQTLETLQR